MTRKIYTVGGSYGYANWMQGVPTKSLEEADLVLFTGGEDVSPFLYGKQPHPASFFNPRRDQYEIEQFQEARKLKKKFIGICRGAQFLCVMAGGLLVQHQRHPWQHPMLTHTGKEITVTSTHHQRQYPWAGDKPPKFELLGWCDKLSPYSYGENNQDDMSDHLEVEMASYPNIRALAIQPHPEMAFPPINAEESAFIKFCRDLLDSHMEQ